MRGVAARVKMKGKDLSEFGEIGDPVRERDIVCAGE